MKYLKDDAGLVHTMWNGPQNLEGPPLTTCRVHVDGQTHLGPPTCLACIAEADGRLKFTVHEEVGVARGNTAAIARLDLK